MTVVEIYIPKWHSHKSSFKGGPGKHRSEAEKLHATEAKSSQLNAVSGSECRKGQGKQNKQNELMTPERVEVFVEATQGKYA